MSHFVSSQTCPKHMQNRLGVHYVQNCAVTIVGWVRYIYLKWPPQSK